MLRPPSCRHARQKSINPGADAAGEVHTVLDSKLEQVQVMGIMKLSLYIYMYMHICIYMAAYIWQHEVYMKSSRPTGESMKPMGVQEP